MTRSPSRLLALAAFAATVYGADQSVNKTILDRIPGRMKRYVSAQTVAGTATMVVHRDQIVEFEATGMVDVQNNQPMRKDTIFQVMSDD